MLSHEEAMDIYMERQISSYRFVHEQPQDGDSD